MERKHTRGKWLMNVTNKYLQEDTPGLAITNDEGVLIAYVSHDLTDKSIGEYAANSKLVVASPLLLEGLQMIIDKRSNAGWDAECCALLAEQLIKKATE